MAKGKRVTIIGLTTFGAELARRLAAAGAEVTALDIDALAVQAIADFVADARRVDARDVETLREIGVDRSDLVVVSIRERLEISVLIVDALQELGVNNEKIIALAAGVDQVRVLEKLGVRDIIFPERDVALSKAHLILNPGLQRYIELAEGYSMVEIAPPADWIGQTLLALDIRKRFNLNVVALRADSRPTAPLLMPTPDYKIENNDRLLIIGPNDKIRLVAKDSV